MFNKMRAKLFEIIYEIYYWFFDRFIIYPIMKTVSSVMRITFMNLGYALNGEETKILEFTGKYIDESNSDYNHILLYEKCLSFHPKYPNFRDLTLLEIGCGQGGGLAWLKRSRPEIKALRGIDPVVVDSMNGMIRKGKADSIPLQSNSVDIVVNVESSHLYKNPEMFFQEVHRVLKPGGHLCWIDLRHDYQLHEPYEQAKAVGFDLAQSEDVTAQVVEGIRKTSAKYDAMLDRAPWFARLFSGSLRETYCAPGTHSFNRLDTRQKLYHCATWRKN